MQSLMTNSDTSPLEPGPIRRRVEAWLQVRDDEARAEQLFDWLQGYGFLPFDQDYEPYYLIAGTIVAGPEGAADRKRFAESLTVVLDNLESYLPLAARPEQAAWNAFQLCVEVAHPAILWPPLYRILDLSRNRPDAIPLDESWRGMSIRAAFLNALANNQVDEMLADHWTQMVAARSGLLQGAPEQAWAGLARIPRTQANWPRQAARLGSALRALTSQHHRDPDLKPTTTDLAVQYVLAVAPPRNAQRELLDLTDTPDCVSLSDRQLAEIVPTCIHWFGDSWACWKPVGEVFVDARLAEAEEPKSNGRYLLLKVSPKIADWLGNSTQQLARVRIESLAFSPISIKERVRHMIDSELVDQIRSGAGTGGSKSHQRPDSDISRIGASRRPSLNEIGQAVTRPSDVASEAEAVRAATLMSIHRSLSIAALGRRLDDGAWA